MSVCSIKKELLVHLLDKKLVDVNRKDSFGRTALHYACSLGRVDFGELLLKYGADINALNNAGETPLFKACAVGEVEMVEWLLQQPGIKVDFLDIVDASNSVWQKLLRPSFDFLQRQSN